MIAREFIIALLELTPRTRQIVPPLHLYNINTLNVLIISYRIPVNLDLHLQ